MQGDDGAPAVKTGLAEDLVAAKFAINLSKNLRPVRLLALCGSGRYISPEFPDIASGGA
jgi:hypothetical protein